MIDWAIQHSPYFGVAALAFAAGVVFAAARQVRLEQRRRKIRRWVSKTRSV